MHKEHIVHYILVLMVVILSSLIISLFNVAMIHREFDKQSFYIHEQMNMRDYQIAKEIGFYTIYDGSRVVGRLPMNDESNKIDSIILFDAKR